MAYYAVSERRLRPGGLDNYLAASSRIIDFWGGRAGEYFYRIYVSEQNPTDAMTIGAWPSPEEFAAAYARLPIELRDGPAAFVDQGHGEWTWFQGFREIESIGQHTRLITATRFEVQEDELTATQDWMREIQDQTIEIAGVVATRVLCAVDRPRQFIVLNEYSEPAAKGAVAALVERGHPPTDTGRWRTFVGRPGFQWNVLDHRQSDTRR